MRIGWLLLLIILTSSVFAQRKTKIKLVKANKLTPAVYHGIKAQKLSGDVVFKHDKTLMYCDSAYFYEGSNTLDAFGNIHINDNKKVHIYSDTLKYSGNSKMAIFINNVILKDSSMTLTTNMLKYNLKTKIGNYITGGKIVDNKNVLTSKHGFYHSDIKTFYFQKNVKLVNPDYVMTSDTLIYNVNTEISYFKGPTLIVSNENSIYCENGWYNSRTNISSYSEHTFLRNTNQKLYSDSLYYDKNNAFGNAFNNVTLIDSVQNIVVKGNRAFYQEGEGSSYVTDSSLAILISGNTKEDSLYLHADTLRIEFNKDQEARLFIAYNKVKFYKTDLQGKCDSMVYRFEDSVLVMYHQPLIWGSNSQLSGKKIRTSMRNKKIDRIYIDTNSFVLQHDTLDYYNQVSGKNMIAYFKNDSIEKVDVLGNAQSVYFARDENNNLVGVNLGSSSDMRVDFNSEGVSNIVYLGRPKASLNPIKKVSKRALYLRNFKSYDYWRPKNKYEIFDFEPAKP
jgi:lipopolysaccharide export system protein LptA